MPAADDQQEHPQHDADDAQGGLLWEDPVFHSDEYPDWTLDQVLALARQGQPAEDPMLNG